MYMYFLLRTCSDSLYREFSKHLELQEGQSAESMDRRGSANVRLFRLSLNHVSFSAGSCCALRGTAGALWWESCAPERTLV